MGAYSPGSFPAADSIVVPSVNKMSLTTNYLDLSSETGKGWAQQYVPDLYEQEVDRYGNRTISGFLNAISAEFPTTSDEIVWSEQGRLHLAYSAKGTAGATSYSITATKNIDTGASENHGVRIGQTVVIQHNDAKVFKGIVTAIPSATALTVEAYAAADMRAAAQLNDTAERDIKFFVYGSEFNKGAGAMPGSVEPNFKSFNNNLMIIKDHFEINGSDVSQIGWIEVSGEAGQNGFLWYLKSLGDTRARFNDYLEMTMVEAEKVVGSSRFATGDNDTVDPLIANNKGSEGLFKSIEERGIVAQDVVDTATKANDGTDGINDFDVLLGELDKQGAIEENMLYLNRDANLVVDDMLAGLSSGAQGGTAYGIFNNSEDMALNLGFTGFRRGSYDFYKTDWKYLNDSSTRGAFAKSAGNTVDGVLIPAGTTSVYDAQVGANARKPFLHVRYRASNMDDRKMKSWVTGSVGAATSGVDKMEVHYLSERCLIVQAANNFVLLK